MLDMCILMGCLNGIKSWSTRFFRGGKIILGRLPNFRLRLGRGQDVHSIGWKPKIDGLIDVFPFPRGLV